MLSRDGYRLHLQRSLGSSKWPEVWFTVVITPGQMTPHSPSLPEALRIGEETHFSPRERWLCYKDIWEGNAPSELPSRQAWSWTPKGRSCRSHIPEWKPRYAAQGYQPCISWSRRPMPRWLKKSLVARISWSRRPMPCWLKKSLVAVSSRLWLPQCHVLYTSCPTCSHVATREKNTFLVHFTNI